MSTVRFVLPLLLAATASLSHASQEPGESVRQFLDAKRFEANCTNQRDNDACKTGLGYLDKSLKAADTAFQKRLVLRSLAQVNGVYGRNLREAGNLNDSLAVLGKAYQRVLAAYDEGKNPSALLESISLQNQYLTSLIESGNTISYDDVLQRLRAASDENYKNIDAIKRDGTVFDQKLALGTIDASIEFEGQQAATLQALAKKPNYTPGAAALLKEKAVAALERKLVWLERRYETIAYKAGLPAGVGEMKRLIDISNSNLTLGNLYLAAGKSAEAQQKLSLAMTSTCQFDVEGFKDEVGAKDVPADLKTRAAAVCGESRKGLSRLEKPAV